MQDLIGWFSNPIVLAIAGLAVRFAPGVKERVANDMIPLLTAALAFLSGLVAPEVAAIAAGPFGLHNLGYQLIGDGQVAAGSGFLAFGGAFAGLGAALWQSTQSWVLGKWFLKPLTPHDPPDSRKFFRKEKNGG